MYCYFIVYIIFRTMCILNAKLIAKNNINFLLIINKKKSTYLYSSLFFDKDIYDNLFQHLLK